MERDQVRVFRKTQEEVPVMADSRDQALVDWLTGWGLPEGVYTNGTGLSSTVSTAEIMKAVHEMKEAKRRQLMELGDLLNRNFIGGVPRLSIDWENFAIPSGQMFLTEGSLGGFQADHIFRMGVAGSESMPWDNRILIKSDAEDHVTGGQNPAPPQEV